MGVHRVVSKAPVTLRQRNLKTHQSPVNLDLCLRKTPAGKSRDYRDVIDFVKLRFQNFFFPWLNSSQIDELGNWYLKS